MAACAGAPACSAGRLHGAAGTYQKKPLFHSRERLALLNEALFVSAEKYGWELQAWAVFANHYHFVAHSPISPASLRQMIQHLHAQTALAINAQDHAVVRKVWYQYWDSLLTYPKSYDARLAYVHQPASHSSSAQYNSPLQQKKKCDLSVYP